MKQRKIVIVGVFLCLAVIASVHFYQQFNPTMSKHFPSIASTKHSILATKHNIALFDGSVSWVIQSNSPNNFMPPGFTEIPFSLEKSSKYYEVQSNLLNLYPEKELSDKFTILVGGPNGNSFIGIDTSNNLIVLYRFWS